MFTGSTTPSLPSPNAVFAQLFLILFPNRLELTEQRNPYLGVVSVKKALKRQVKQKQRKYIPNYLSPLSPQ